MKKRLLLLVLLYVSLTILLAGCSGFPAPEESSENSSESEREPSSESSSEPASESRGSDTVSLTANAQVVFLKDRQVVGYDFASLFTLKVNGETVPIEDAWLDYSLVKSEPSAEPYTVICTYGVHQAVAKISVTKTNYMLNLSVDTVSMTVEAAENYDFNALFEAKMDGVTVPVTDDMVTTDYKPQIGTYTYTVSFGDRKKTLSINIVDNHRVEVVRAYRSLSMTAEELAGYDLTKLFSLYVDGDTVAVTAAMLTSDIPASPVNGESYTVTLQYSTDKWIYRASIPITVVTVDDIIITARDVETYPNSEAIDLTTLFTIKQGERYIPVTRDMITGTVNYASEGENRITLTYRTSGAEKSATAVVTVKRGVVIRFADTDTVLIRRGTDINSYPFTEDFILTVNGTRFSDFPASYIDISGVDFTKAGTYTATLTVRYNKDPLTGLTGNANYSTHTATIRYCVVENTYSVNVNKDQVVLPKGTTRYNPFYNLTVYINGRWQTLTDDPNVTLDPISCYARLVSASIDFGSAAVQNVIIDVYVNGRDADPVRVSYTLRVESDVTVTATDTAVFVGNKLYVCDLFSIKNAGQRVDVTYDMITGYVDVTTPGVYRLELNYGGVTATATVTVLDNSIVGTYHTSLRNISQADDEDEEGYTIIGTPSRPLGDLIIRADGTITVDGMNGMITGGFGTESMTAKIGTNVYYLYYRDGILVLDPDNSLKLSFNNTKRPMVYFHGDMWEITGNIILNKLSTHILQTTNTGYSYDLMRVRSKTDERELWYALYICLVSKTSADTVYEVKWGEIDLDTAFTPAADATASFMFNGDEVSFKMTNKTIARPAASEKAPQWANRTFTGTINGKNATLKTDFYERYTLRIDGNVIFSGARLADMLNGEVDYDAGILFLYNVTAKDDAAVYSYKFLIDAENNTFTVAERDPYYGRYTADGMVLFLDGYGSGVMSFDANSYAQTKLTYTVKDSELTVQYIGTSPVFAYGKSAVYIVAPFLNVLTVREFSGADMKDKAFVNEVITDGAIVTVSSHTVGMTGNSNELLSYITIVTADGVLSDAEKKACVGVKTVKFGAAGFYQYTVTVKVNGEDVTAYYAVQVLGKIDTAYRDMAISYGQGLLYPNNSLKVDEFGRVTYYIGDTVYTGLADFYDDGFIARLTDTNGIKLLLTAKKYAENTLEVRMTGAMNGSDIFTRGETSVTSSASDSAYLRSVKLSDGTVLYFFSKSAIELGERVILAPETGSDLTVTGVTLILTADGDEIACLRVNEWGKAKTGLTLSDAFRGSYKLGNKTITFDGFGKGTFEGKGNITYRIKGDMVTISFDDSENVIACKPNPATGETKLLTPVGSGSMLVSGFTYYATYTFACGSELYEATTSIRFEAGEVKILSTSESHDSGDGMCTDDSGYAPPFVGMGTYTVKGDVITVNIKGYTMVFIVTDVTTSAQIVCESTTIKSSDHGYFGAGRAFSR